MARPTPPRPSALALSAFFSAADAVFGVSAAGLSSPTGSAVSGASSFGVSASGAVSSFTASAGSDGFSAFGASSVFGVSSGAAVSSAAGISASAAVSGAVSFCAEAGCGLSSGRPVSFSLSVMLSLPALYSWKLYHESKSMSIFLNAKAAPPKRDGFSGSDRHGEPQLFQTRAQRSGSRLKAVRLRRRRPARGRAAKCTRPPQCQPAYIRSG